MNSIIRDLLILVVSVYGLAFMCSWTFGGPRVLNDRIRRMCAWLGAFLLRILSEILRWVGRAVASSGRRYPRITGLVFVALVGAVVFLTMVNEIKVANYFPTTAPTTTRPATTKKAATQTPSTQSATRGSFFIAYRVRNVKIYKYVIRTVGSVVERFVHIEEVAGPIPAPSTENSFNIMVNKFLGYVILAIGLIIIIGAVWSSYNIFTGSASLPEIFRASPQPASPSGSGLDIQKQIADALNQQLGNLIPYDSISKMLNLFSWSMLAGILILGGGQLAGLGIKLVAIKEN